MEYSDLLYEIKSLKIGNSISIFNEYGVEIFISRPEKAFKDYKLEKNFQVFIKEGERTFRPNHLRVMLDLNLRVRSRPDLKNDLLNSFDDIYYRKNSIVSIQNLESEKFEHFLNPIKVIAILSQLFIIEQDFNYDRESNFEPPTLFYQGWIRQFIDNTKEIDNLAMSLCNRQPPSAKYTNLENKKSKKFIEQLPRLWYLD